MLCILSTAPAERRVSALAVKAMAKAEPRMELSMVWKKFMPGRGTTSRRLVGAWTEVNRRGERGEGLELSGAEALPQRHDGDDQESEEEGALRGAAVERKDALSDGGPDG